MNENEKLIARRLKVVPRGVGMAAGPVTAVSGKGARLVDADGREWIDFAGGIGVLNVGHCDERVVRAIQEQAEKLVHTCFHVATYEPYVALCERLVELFPHGDETRALLLNSGAEAVENAVKIARQATGRQGVLCFSGAFHGRTLLGMSLTSKTGYKIGCGPFAPEVYRLRYPNHYKNGWGATMEDFVTRELSKLEEALTTFVAPEQLAAIVIEPVQGEGGFVPAPFDYLRGLRRLCDEHGILLILDEVQSGFCRTGRWAAYEHAGVVPDLSTWAKSMGGGMPISTVIGRAEVMDAARPGTLGGTYGGNPVACAASLACIDAMEEMDLNARATHIGETVRRRFLALRERCDLVGDVRGLGAMIGLELSLDRDPRRPAKAECAAVMELCREQRLLVLPAGSHANVIRILSPLTISDEDLGRGLDIVESAVLAVSAKEITRT